MKEWKLFLEDKITVNLTEKHIMIFGDSIINFSGYQKSLSVYLDEKNLLLISEIAGSGISKTGTRFVIIQIFFFLDIYR